MVLSGRSAHLRQPEHALTDALWLGNSIHKEATQARTDLLAFLQRMHGRAACRLMACMIKPATCNARCYWRC